MAWRRREGELYVESEREECCLVQYSKGVVLLDPPCSTATPPYTPLDQRGPGKVEVQDCSGSGTAAKDIHSVRKSEGTELMWEAGEG